MSSQTPPAATRHVPSLPLLATLGGAGAVAGLLIVLVYQFTLPTVLANRAARLDTAIHQVVPGSARYETLYLLDGGLRAGLPPGVDGRKLDRIYAGFDGQGRPIGYAIPASQPGFQDTIDVIFGFDPSRPGTLGLVVLGSRETPGLGDKIEAPEWLALFETARTPITPVKAGTSQAPSDVDLITGATISSRTVLAAINEAVARWAPLIEAYRTGGAS